MDKMRALLDSPAYIRADDDANFLHRDELRGTRLQLEYLKPELTLQELGIKSTIVLFGGTRIVEASEAVLRLGRQRERLAASPNDPDLRRQVSIAERIVAKSRYYDVARKFARLVAAWTKETGRDGEFIVTTGGGPGIMEAGNRGAHEAGVPTIGLNISLPMEQAPNAYISPELCFQFRYFALRKLHFIHRAQALVAFPGGFGTLDELFNALCLVQTRKMKPIPIILVGRDFWHAAFDAEFLASEGVIAPADVDLIHYAENADEIANHIRQWYEPAVRNSPGTETA